jgi:hypothetical protein
MGIRKARPQLGPDRQHPASAESSASMSARRMADGMEHGRRHDPVRRQGVLVDMGRDLIAIASPDR